jgi:predicted nucleic acid-binding protein
VSVLADRSVWVQHWRRGLPEFRRLLEQSRIVIHPFVLGELALGLIAPRADVLRDLSALDSAPSAEHDEVLALVERAHLWGRGIGWVDAHLLASARLDRLSLWTLDRQVARAARDLGVALIA